MLFFLSCMSLCIPFQCIEGSDDVKRLLSVSYLEIYKEELRDLLQDTSYSANKEIVIREDDCGRTSKLFLESMKKH